MTWAEEYCPDELLNNWGEVMLLPVVEELTKGERVETVLFDGVLGGEISCTLPIGLPVVSGVGQPLDLLEAVLTADVLEPYV